MRKRYQASFFLNSRSEGQIRADDVAGQLLAWIPLSGWGDCRVSREDLVKPNGELKTFLLREEAKLDCGSFQTEKGLLLGARLSHPDKFDPSIRWSTEIVAKVPSEEGAVGFSCVNRVGQVNGYYTRVNRDPSRPRIVRDVLARWKGSHGLPLSTTAAVLRVGEEQRLLSALNDENRTRPLVFISCQNREERAIVDAEGVADWLSGIAHVVVAENSQVSWNLGSLLPSRLNAWDGAVRIYWPSFSPADSQWKHKLWLPYRVGHFEDWLPGGFRQELLKELMEVSAHVIDPDLSGWEEIESEIRRIKLQAARESGRQDELLQLFDEENKRLEGDNNNLSAQLEDALRNRDEMSSKLYLANQELEGWRQGKSQAKPDVLDEDHVVCESMSEAIRLAGERFGPKIAFALNSKSDGEDSLFDDPDAVFRVFRFLATTYFEARAGTKPCTDLPKACATETGWQYKPRQSEVTMAKYEDWYQTRYLSQKVQLPEHIGKGTSKDPRHTIRIGFTWLAEEGQVLIGFLGQHQRTSAT